MAIPDQRDVEEKSLILLISQLSVSGSGQGFALMARESQVSLLRLNVAVTRELMIA